MVNHFIWQISGDCFILRYLKYSDGLPNVAEIQQSTRPRCVLQVDHMARLFEVRTVLTDLTALGSHSITVVKYYWLVVSTPLKNISQLGLLFPYIMENKKCLKPPTRLNMVKGPSKVCLRGIP